MKNEKLNLPVATQKSKDVYKILTIVQTLALLIILGINLFFLYVIWESRQFAERNRHAVDLVIEKLEDAQIISPDEKEEIKKEVVPDADTKN